MKRQHLLRAFLRLPEAAKDMMIGQFLNTLPSGPIHSQQVENVLTKSYHASCTMLEHEDLAASLDLSQN